MPFLNNSTKFKLYNNRFIQSCRITEQAKPASFNLQNYPWDHANFEFPGAFEISRELSPDV
jgi:hypothetical protein